MPQPDVLLRDNVTLQCECVDRLLLNGYIPTLQAPGQLVLFLRDVLGQKIPSPVVLDRITKRFVRAVHKFAETHGIPIIRFEKEQRKESVARSYFDRMIAEGKREGVALIGIAQERVRAFRSSTIRTPSGLPRFQYSRVSVCVNQYYFYLLDRDFGPGFIKISSYAPFGLRIWLNGHEWAKCRLEDEGIDYEALDNGFLTVEDAQRLQEICDELSHRHIERFFQRWLDILPFPLLAEESRRHPYRLSILQMEFSLTHVFDKPLRGRQYFEEIIRDNLDLGRPDCVQLIFGRRITRRTPGRFRTRVLTTGVEPSIHIDYKRSRIKQYYKNGRALRTELTINNTYDFGVKRGLRNLEYLRDIGRNANRRLLDVQRASQCCHMSASTFEEVVLPSHGNDGQRAPSLRFGDPRVMALLAALCGFFHLPDGFGNQAIRQRVAALLGNPEGYSRGRMTYDLRRLRLNGLIRRIGGGHTYMVTPKGSRVALLFTKFYGRVLRKAPLDLDATRPSRAPPRLEKALRALDLAVDNELRAARLAV